MPSRSLANRPKGYFLQSLSLHPKKIYKILNLMKPFPLKQEQDEQFQQMKEQVLTYDLLESNSPKIVVTGVKKHNKERQKLQLLPKEEVNRPKQLDWKNVNKTIKKITNNWGKIIPVGSAVFKSNFECGNIANVLLTGPTTYQIQLQRETNSARVSNWFYFSVEGVKGEATFIIRGFTKSSSLYNQGMKICYREGGELGKWRRGATKIVYTSSCDDEQEKETYQLRFSFFFKNNERTCIEFACSFPYSYSRLLSLIKQIKQQVDYKPLCKSFNGLDVPLLTIGNDKSQEVIVISARVHPGETVSSFIVQGFIKELVGQGEFGKYIRSNYLIKVVPMLNPDGVVKGNYRFSGYGCDLNRKWKNCRETGQPEIYYMRELIKNSNKDRKVVMYIDIHGHSRKKNVFFYGCCDPTNPSQTPMQFPYLMEKISEAFRFDYCSFNVDKDKEGTARVAMWRELKIDHIYTLESSFCGPEFGPNYLENDYDKVGRKLCEGIAVFFHKAEAKEVLSEGVLEKMLRIKEKAFAELSQRPQLVQAKSEDNAGSESEPQTGQILQKDRNPDTGLPRPELLSSLSKKKQKNKQNLLMPPNYSSFRDQKPPLLHSQASLKQRLNPVRKTEIKTDIGESNELEDSRQPQRMDDFQVNLDDFVNLVEMPTKSPDLHQQRNIRVYSLTRNADNHSSNKPKQSPNRPVHQSPPIEQPRGIMPSQLLHGRQGVQYRRVRKLAEQTYKKESTREVVQLQGNQMYMTRLDRSRVQPIVAPRFYPVSRQKSRRASVEVYLRKNQQEEHPRSKGGRRDLSFKCMGTEITKYRLQ